MQSTVCITIFIIDHASGSIPPSSDSQASVGNNENNAADTDLPTLANSRDYRTPLTKHWDENIDRMKLNGQIDWYRYCASLGCGSIVQFGGAFTRAETQTTNAYVGQRKRGSRAYRMHRWINCNCATPEDTSVKNTTIRWDNIFQEDHPPFSYSQLKDSVRFARCVGSSIAEGWQTSLTNILLKQNSSSK